MPEAAIVGHANSAGSPAVEGSPNVSIGGAPVLRVGDHFADGSAVDAGAPHVFINGKPAARMGDAVSGGGAILQGCPRVKIGNGGGAAFGQSLALDALAGLRDNPALTPGERLALCLPEMAAAMAERVDEVNRQGWIYLHEGLMKWFSRPAAVMPDDKFHNGCQEPLMMDWHWLMQYFRFSYAVTTLTMESYLLEWEARQTLTRILENEGAFAGSGMPFDHTILPWHQLRRHAFHGKSVPYGLHMIDPDIQLIPDGFSAAIGATVVYALAAGETQVSASGERKVFIRKIGRFIHDGFDFNGDQWLGNWLCEKDRKGFALFTGARLENSDFRALRARTGYGCDFRSICLPDVVEVEEFWYLAP